MFIFPPYFILLPHSSCTLTSNKPSGCYVQFSRRFPHVPHAISSTLSLNLQPPQKSILIYTPVPLQQIIQLGIFFLQTYLCNVHFSLYKISFFQINTKICTSARAKVVSFLVSFVKFQISCMISLKTYSWSMGS